MPGRSCRCLLALSFLILPPAALRAQSGQINPAPNYALPLSLGHPTDGDQTPPLSPPRPGLPRPVPGFPPSFSPITPPVTVGFPLIARAAGTIFSGTVTAVARHPPTRGQAVETVEITFHIENAIRGATSGQSLTISQWLGLWSAGQRYRVGERVLLFLYPPEQAWTHQLRGRQRRPLRDRPLGTRPALGATSCRLSRRSRSGWQVASPLQRLRARSAAHRGGKLNAN
jgi:hypothetical protein